MTSQASSVNKKKTKSAFWVNFKNNFKSQWGIPGAILFFTTLFYPITCLMSVRDIFKQHAHSKYIISDHFTFLITDQVMIQKLSEILPFAMIFAGIIIGFLAFKFMNNKKEVNVYYSLGITRTKLFLSTYLANFTKIVLAVVLPMLAVWIINISYFGGSKELTSAILYVIISSIALITFAFTITCLVSTKVGSNSEVIIYSIVLAFLPNIIIFFLSNLFELFVFGSPYGSDSFSHGELIDTADTLSGKLAFINPKNCIDKLSVVSMLDENKNLIGACSNSGVPCENLKWIAPKLTRALGWFITSVVLCCGCTYTINKRPAEIAGFFGADKKTNIIMSFIFGLGVAFTTIAILRECWINETYKLTLLGLLAFVLTYIIFNAIVARKKKPFVKSLKQLPIHIAILACITLIFSTGLFGYSKKVPEIKDIKSIDMEIPSGRTLGLTYNHGIHPYNYLSFGDSQYAIYDFKDKKDIKMITDLHKKVIGDGKVSPSAKKNPKDKDFVSSTQIVFKYKLKNGKTLTRVYSAAQTDTLKEFLILENSDRYKELLREAMIDKSNSTEKSNILHGNPIKSVFKDNDYNVYIMSKNQDISNALDLNDKQKQELVKCMYKDLTENSSNTVNCPKGEALGSIQFFKNGVEFSNPETEQEYAPEDTPEDSDSQKELAKNENVKKEFDYYHLKEFNNDDNAYKFIVTTDMKNTMKFLEDNALLQYLDSKTKIVKAEVLSKKMFMKFEPYLLKSGPIFVGGKLTNRELRQTDANTNVDKQFKKGYVTNDNSVIQKLNDNSYYSYFVPNNCYYVKYTLENKDVLIMCIPDNKMPNNIKSIIDKK